MNRRIVRMPWILLLAFGASAVLATRTYADTAVTGGTFVTTNQSIWDTGSAFSKSYNTSVGMSFNAHPSIGTGIGCGLFGDCYGAEAALHLSGNLGINLGAHVDSGALDATMPFSATVGFPDAVTRGSTFTPTANVTMGLGTFTTTAPNVGAFADLTGHIYAGASARICFIDCAGTSGTIVNAGFTTEIAAINRNGDGQIRIFGNEVPMEAELGPTEWEFKLPTGATGAGTELLAGTASTNVVHAGLDVAGVVGDALGVPLSGSLGGVIDWGLISASATIDAYLNQAFLLDPDVLVNLHVVETGQDVYCMPGLGCQAIAAVYGGHYLTIQPYFLMDATLANNTGLVFAPGYDVSLLWAGISGLGSIGPAWHWDDSFPLPPISLYSRTFDLEGFNVVEGDPFRVALLDQPENVPEPASLTLLGSGILSLALLRRRRSNGRKG